jgi:hypothetical protein
MSKKSEIQTTLSAIRAQVGNQKTGATAPQARAIANCEAALANIAKYESEAEKRAASRPVEITFIDRERLKIAAEKAPTLEARDAARRMLDRNPPRMTESEKKKFKL